MQALGFDVWGKALQPLSEWCDIGHVAVLASECFRASLRCGPADGVAPSGTDKDREALLAEDVRLLFESKKANSSTSKPPRVVPIERAGVDAILQGDDQELEELGKKLKETIEAFEENESHPTVVLPLSHPFSSTHCAA